MAEHGLVLLTGPTGFIGGAILSALRQHSPRQEVRLLTRTPEKLVQGSRVRAVAGSLGDPRSLAGACASVDTLIHAASYVGPDPNECEAVNAAGTAALVRAAGHAGVRRVIAVSTAAVHGRGPHRNVAPAATPLRPQSAVSATRLAGEEAVRAAQGIVVRPHLVYGAGDRWVVPAIARLVAGSGLDVTDPAALHSLVHVVELAQAIVGLVDVEDAILPPGSVVGGGHPVPTTTDHLVRTITEHLGLRPSPDWTTRAEPHPNHVALLATDHWFASVELWKVTGVEPGPAFPEGFARCAEWYRESLPAASGARRGS